MPANTHTYRQALMQGHVGRSHKYQGPKLLKLQQYHVSKGFFE